MTYTDLLKAAFTDELQKIAAVRLGRKPYMAQTLANATKFVKNGVMTKISARANLKPLLVAGGIGAGAGALGMHQGKRAVDDFRTGRALRKAHEQGQVG